MDIETVDAIFQWLQSDSAPAWVQAVLSAAAVLAAVWVAHRQHENDRWIQILADRKRRDSILTLVERVAEGAANTIRDFCDEVDKISDGGPENILLDEIFRAERECLDGIPIHEINDSQLVADVVDLKIILNIFPKQLSRMVHGTTVLGEESTRMAASREYRDAFVDKCKEHIQNIDQTISDIRKELGHMMV